MRNDSTRSDFPMARIDAQDESYILPLREYLESHGVDVVVNSPSETNELYHIVAGDATYVKQIFSRAHEKGVKRLGIVLAGGKLPVEFSARIKIVTTNPTPMTTSEVMEVFEFFFTEGKNHLALHEYHETRTLHEQVETDDARVRSIIADVFADEATPTGRGIKEKKRRRRKFLRAWMLGALIGIAIFIIPTMWYAISMVVGGVAVADGTRALRQGSISRLAWDTRISEYWVHQGEFVLSGATIPLSWFGDEDMLRGQQRLVSFLKDATQAEEEAGALTTLAGRVAAGLLNQVDATSTGTTAASDVSTLRISLYTLGNTLGLAQAELQLLLADKTFPFSMGILAGKGTTAVEDLSDIRRSTGDIDKLLSLFLSLAGFKEPRTYLILLQNSMELRPTGGFIGSVAIASFAQGRLTNLDVQDVYTFDGQLKGHVDPPVPIKELLAQEHWYLRDSNWDPDFKEAGARAAWFYEKETGTKVDGVIGISTPFITNLLTATGPILLTDYNDRITAENFYGKSMYYTQNDFFPGSTQKKDFLGSLSHSMLSVITSGKGVNTSELFGAITKALSSHDLMMMYADPDLEALVTQYGWAGRVPPDIGCTGVDASTCFFDPYIAVEANLGVNKVNYFVTRSLERDISVAPDGTRTETMTTTIHNGSSAKDKNLPYRVYVRFLLPNNSSVATISLDDTPVASRSGTKVPSLPYTEPSTVASGQFALGVALDVPASSEKKLTITYTELKPLPFGPSGTVLDVFTEKQPGIADENVYTQIRYPSEWTAGIEEHPTAQATQDFIAKQGQLEYNTSLATDALTRIRFTK